MALCHGRQGRPPPPELLTRDHVARCILREVREGRGSPHGGVYLDIAWIKEHIPDAEEHIKRKLPGMYHQFKELAGIDITKEPMEVGPTTHYAMGGIRVDADTEMSTVPGLFACGECAGGLHGANRLGGNSLSDLLVFGKRAGDHAAAFANERGRGVVDPDQVEEAARSALAPLERKPADDDVGPYRLHAAIQQHMQDHAGIIRDEERLTEALRGLEAFAGQARRLGISGNREFNSAWHTALDLRNILTVAQAVARAALERRESRGAHSRTDYPDKDPEWGRYNLVVKEGAGGMEVQRRPVVEMRQDLKDVIQEMG